MKPLTRYWQTHGGGEPPLRVIYDHVRKHGAPDARGIRELADKARLPESAVRGALSCYADFDASPDAPRVCQGTSCRLA